MRLDWAGWELELGILGCSHQVLVGPGGAGLSEAVACRPGADAPLPRRLVSSCPAGEYAFASDRLALDGPSFDYVSATLLARLGADRQALVGVFPGLPGAFTAIRCAPAGALLEWETWHSYPQTRELVHTATGLRPR